MKLKRFIISILGCLIITMANLPAPADERAVVAEKSATAADSVLMDVGEVLDDLLTPEPYIYQSNINRDPFIALLSADEDEINLNNPTIDDLTVVGVLWGKNDRFAMVETKHGRSLILRKGDPVRNGYVREVLQDGIEVQFSLYGIVQTVVVPVKSGVEDKDER